MTIDNIVHERLWISEIPAVFRVDSILTSEEIYRERRRNPQLQNEALLTNNVAIYTHVLGKDKEDVIITLSGREENPIFKNPYSILAGNKNYSPSIDELKKVFDSNKSVSVMASEIKLVNASKETAYMDIDTKNLGSLNDSQRKVVDYVYGKENVERSMAKLAKDEIYLTRIGFLNPIDYVAKTVELGDSLARGCMVFEQGSDFTFSAAVSFINNRVNVRGEPCDDTEREVIQTKRQYGSEERYQKSLN